MAPEIYLVKQPKALQKLALDKLAVHIGSFADENSLKLLSGMLKHHPDEAEKLLNRRIEYMRNKIKSTMPWMYYDELTDNVMHQLLKLLQNRNFNNHLSHKYIIGRTMEILYTNRLTSLVFPKDPYGVYLQFLLYSRADYLTGLTHLRLIDTSLESDIIRLLMKFHSLKSLDLTNVCTDNILYCIAENCKLIESLKIEGHNSECSLGITDNSVNMLTKLLNLKSIELYNTSVTKFGIATLLLSCKNLERIILLHVDLIEPLEYIVSSSGYMETQFKMKFYENIKVITQEQLQLVYKMCPQIEDLSIKNRYLDNNLNLSALTDLQYLKIEDYEFYEDQVEALLKASGHNLVKLHLEFISQLDLNAARWIYEMCPNLKSLTLTSCSIEYEQVIEKNNKITLHKYLEQISFVNMYSYEFVETEDAVIFLLSHCPNIQFIDLELSRYTINNVLLEVMNKSPRCLAKLEKLTVDGDFQTEVLNRIVNNCINPVEIINTRGCGYS